MKMGGSSTYIMLGLIAVIIVIFALSSISSRKKRKEEKKKRQREVREVIKRFMRNHLNLQHKMIEFDQVVSRNGKEYRYRDVFDVIVKLFDSKTNELFTTKAFEVEGFAKKISKKEFETIWKVNNELDLEETMQRIELAKKKAKKVRKKTLEEKAAFKKSKEETKQMLDLEKQATQRQRKQRKEMVKPKIPVSEKFSGTKTKDKK